MSRPDSDADDPTIERVMREAIRELPFPQTPSLEHATRKRVVRRIQQRLALATAAAFLVGLLVFVPWRPANPVADHKNPVASVSPQLDSSDLDSLFAPPPVDSLSVLDQRQFVSIHVLQQLENRQ